MLLPPDLAIKGRVADRAVDPVVKTVAQIARAGVCVARAEASEEHLAHIRLVVTVGVLEKEKLRRVRHDDAAAREGERCGDVQAVGKDFHPVTFAVAVGILENFDAIIALAAGLDLVWVIDALGDPQPPALVPLHVNGIHDLRFGGKKLQLPADGHLRVLHALGGRQRQLVGQWLGAFFVIGNVVALLVFQWLAARQKFLVASLRCIARGPEDAALEQLMKTSMAPNARVMA